MGLSFQALSPGTPVLLYAPFPGEQGTRGQAQKMIAIKTFIFPGLPPKLQDIGAVPQPQGEW